MNKSPVLMLVLAVSLLVGVVPLWAAPKDVAIKQAIEQTEIYQTILKDEDIKVAVRDGVVTLTGTVSNAGHKSLAQSAAANLAGVGTVNNLLGTEEELAQAKTDLWIERQVKLSLLFHRGVNASATTVAAKNGVVTLTGEARDLDQRDLTTKYAWTIKEVRQVINLMTLAPRPTLGALPAAEVVDDAMIESRVSLALLADHASHSYSANAISKEGVVTLTGWVMDEAEKDRVTIRVAAVHGVKQVDNQMAVKPPTVDLN